MRTDTSESPAGTIPADLVEFLDESRDAREYRRGMAVTWALQGMPHQQIAALLDVTVSCICKMKQAYRRTGVAGLALNYHGAKPLLTPSARADGLTWLRTHHTWSLLNLKQYIQQTHQVVFQSDQSYYDLFAAAGIRYKKTQAVNPKQNPAQIAEKKRDYHDHNHPCGRAPSRDDGAALS